MTGPKLEGPIGFHRNVVRPTGRGGSADQYRLETDLLEPTPDLHGQRFRIHDSRMPARRPGGIVGRVAAPTVALVLLLAAGWLYTSGAARAPQVPAQFTFAAPAAETLEIAPAVPSPDGTRIVFGARDASGERALWIRREVRIAPNGKVASVAIPDPDSRNRDIWIVDLQGGGLTRLTAHPANDWRVAWSPDSAQIAFASDRNGTWQTVGDSSWHARFRTPARRR